MKQLPDDPIISCMMRTGEPPWIKEENGEDEDDE